MVRSVGELAIWATFVNTSEANAERFLQENAVDMKELAGYSSAALNELKTEVFPFMEEFWAGLPKRVNLRHQTDVDKYIFKLCSKYIHPSAWLLSNLKQINGLSMDRVTLRLFLITYASKIVTTIGP